MFQKTIEKIRKIGGQNSSIILSIFLVIKSFDFSSDIAVKCSRFLKIVADFLSSSSDLGFNVENCCCLNSSIRKYSDSANWMKPMQEVIQKIIAVGSPDDLGVFLATELNVFTKQRKVVKSKPKRPEIRIGESLGNDRN